MINDIIIEEDEKKKLFDPKGTLIKKKLLK